MFVVATSADTSEFTRRHSKLECARQRLRQLVDAEPGVRQSPLPGSLLDVPLVVAEMSLLIDRLESSGLPLDGSVLRQLRAQMGRLDAVVCTGEIEFDQAEGYRDLGNTSLRGFMIDAYGLARPDASRLARRAERLESWPDVAEAWRCGRLTGAQVEAIVTAIPSRFVRLFAEHADGVVNAIAPLDIEATAVALRQWVKMAESTDGPQDFTERRSGLHIDTMLDGTQALSGHFTQSSGAILRAAVHDFAVPDAIDANGDVIGEPRTMSQRAADALVAACEFAIRYRKGAPDAGRFLPHVSVIVDVAELRAAALADVGVRSSVDLERFASVNACSPAERALYAAALTRRGAAATHEGQMLDAPAVAHLTCDSVVHRMMTSKSVPLEMGTEVRSTTPKQRRAIVARDRHCRAPGCRTGPQHCDSHHVVHWAAGGTTDLSNLVLLCGSHHRLFHSRGYQLSLDPVTAELTVRSAAGWSRSTRPEQPERSYFEQKPISR
ncbi:MAG: DUF222 domain-containing protein [Acidimicrobiales bacterium]